MRIVDCPVCQTGNDMAVFEAKSLLGGERQVVVCRSCGEVFVAWLEVRAIAGG